MEHCFSRFLGLRSKRLHPPPPPNGTQFPRQQVHHVQRAKGENRCSAQVHGQGLPGINEQCLSRCDCSHIPRGQLLPLSRVDGADASALNGFNAQAGGSTSGSFFLLATKSRGWYRFTLNRLVSLAYLRCVPFWRAPGGTRTHVSGNCWVRLS